MGSGKGNQGDREPVAMLVLDAEIFGASREQVLARRSVAHDALASLVRDGVGASALAPDVFRVLHDVGAGSLGDPWSADVREDLVGVVGDAARDLPRWRDDRWRAVRGQVGPILSRVAPLLWQVPLLALLGRYVMPLLGADPRSFLSGALLASGVILFCVASAVGGYGLLVWTDPRLRHALGGKDLAAGFLGAEDGVLRFEERIPLVDCEIPVRGLRRLGFALLGFASFRPGGPVWRSAQALAVGGAVLLSQVAGIGWLAFPAAALALLGLKWFRPGDGGVVKGECRMLPQGFRQVILRPYEVRPGTPVQSGEGLDGSVSCRVPEKGLLAKVIHGLRGEEDFWAMVSALAAVGRITGQRYLVAMVSRDGAVQGGVVRDGQLWAVDPGVLSGLLEGVVARAHLVEGGRTPVLEALLEFETLKDIGIPASSSVGAKTLPVLWAKGGDGKPVLGGIWLAEGLVEPVGVMRNLEVVGVRRYTAGRVLSGVRV